MSELRSLFRLLFFLFPMFFILFYFLLDFICLINFIFYLIDWSFNFILFAFVMGVRLSSRSDRGTEQRIHKDKLNIEKGKVNNLKQTH
jgi:hypothetical protein